MKRPTSFDIAALAGVSQATVSRALSRSSSVSEAVRQRVFARRPSSTIRLISMPASCARRRSTPSPCWCRRTSTIPTTASIRSSCR
ncbi:MAG: LacI family DNA-binding transcriptional regulator [Asticcacaulis sp.]